MNSIFHKGFNHCELVKLHRRSERIGRRLCRALEGSERCARSSSFRQALNSAAATLSASLSAIKTPRLSKQAILRGS
jgi:hypothetical protein